MFPLNELKNFFIYFIFRKKILVDIKFYFLILYRKLFYNICRNSYHYYPKNIRSHLSNIKFDNYNYIQKQKRIKKIGKIEFSIINKKFTYTNSKIWRMKFDDPEFTMYLHRWNWLLLSDPHPENNDLQWGEFLIKSYLFELTPISSGIANESYSVGERISNVCLFYREKTKSWNNLPEDIYEAVRIMSSHLIKNLEFYPGKLTGNHILNNARALIIAGHILKIREYIRIGRIILTSFLKNHFEDDGFLIEGSTHYQFLIARWLLEIRMICEDYGDFKTLDKMNPIIISIVEKCKFFLVSDTQKIIPLIGDISPDCSVEWLLDICESPLSNFNKRHTKQKKVKGWACLYKEWKPNKNYLWEQKRNNTKLKNNCPVWSKYKYQNWTIFLHNELKQNLPIASHSHYDFGSFVLFYKDKEIIIDPGRKNYLKSWDDYSLPTAHSTICIDGMPPMLRRGEKIFPGYYGKSFFRIYSRNYANSLCIKLRHNGFKRIRNSDIIHERTFKITNKKIFIKDDIKGSNLHNLEYYFHFSNLLLKNKINKSNKIKQTKLIKDLKLNFNVCQVNSTKDKIKQSAFNIMLSSRSKNYNHDECSIIVYDKLRVVLPIQISYDIELTS